MRIASWSALFLLAALHTVLLVGVVEARIAIIDQYILSHNANRTAVKIVDNVTDTNDLCSRRYLIAQLHCRSSVGNEFMMFLNNLAIGIITNRTLLLHVDQLSCEKKVVFAPWIPRFEKVIGLLGRHCNMSTYIDLNFIDEELESASPITLACCDIDTAHESIPLLKYNRLDRMQASILGVEGARVTNISAKNGRALFNIPGKGPLYGYGQLFQATIKFAKTVTRWNEHYLLQLKQLTNHSMHNVTVLGAHFRHQQVEDHGKLQGYEAETTLKCMRELLPSTRKDYCVIILATDRMHTLLEMQHWAKSHDIMCQFMHSASSHEGEEEDYGGGEKHDKAYVRDEHGPWGDGLLVFTDMHLLAQATAFVGSKGLSTYASSLSILYASIIAAKTGNQRLQRFPPSCTSLSFNGEIFNGTLLHSAGRLPNSAPAFVSQVKDESTWRRRLGSKKKASPAVAALHQSLYERYVVENPVIDCTEQMQKERCSYNLGRRVKI